MMAPVELQWWLERSGLTTELGAEILDVMPNDVHDAMTPAQRAAHSLELERAYHARARWDREHLGPCARCSARTHVYGDGGNPLCDACTAKLPARPEIKTRPAPHPSTDVTTPARLSNGTRAARRLRPRNAAPAAAAPAQASLL